jgi:hypothetical protein
MQSKKDDDTKKSRPAEQIKSTSELLVHDWRRLILNTLFQGNSHPRQFIKPVHSHTSLPRCMLPIVYEQQLKILAVQQ